MSLVDYNSSDDDDEQGAADSSPLKPRAPAVASVLGLPSASTAKTAASSTPANTGKEGARGEGQGDDASQAEDDKTGSGERQGSTTRIPQPQQVVSAEMDTARDDEPSSGEQASDKNTNDDDDDDGNDNGDDDNSDDQPQKKPKLLTPQKQPMEATARLSAEIAQTVDLLLQRKRAGNRDVISIIKQNKQFRNPSIYQELISRMSIDEIGSNFHPSLYNPHRWKEIEFFDKLMEAQDEAESIARFEDLDKPSTEENDGQDGHETLDESAAEKDTGRERHHPEGGNGQESNQNEGDAHRGDAAPTASSSENAHSDADGAIHTQIVSEEESRRRIEQIKAIAQARVDALLSRNQQ